MEARNCPRCGKIFYYTKSPICPDCEKEEEKQFELVKDYLAENPKSKISEITENTGVSIKLINKFLRDGRLEVTEGISDMLKCLGCGKSIKTGRYCDKCANKVSKNLQSAINPRKTFGGNDKKGGPKMHHFKQ